MQIPNSQCANNPRVFERDTIALALPGQIPLEAGGGIVIAVDCVAKSIDRSHSFSILRSGPSAPNGGRSSVRMGVQLEDMLIAAGGPSG